MAIVGCGGMANWHAQTLLKIPDAKVVALVDTVTAHTKAFKEKYFPDAVEYDSFHKMLDRPPKGEKLDAVLLVTPHTLHHSQARTALEYGLHVLVEKPMVTSSEHAYDLWRIVKQTGKQLAISFQSPYRPEFGCLAKMRDTGALGKVQIVSGWLAQNWLSFTTNTWRQDPSLSGGGQMYDSGAHLPNAMMWLMNDPVVEVSCMYDTLGSPVDINGVAIVRFQNGALGSVAIGGNCPANFRYDLQIQTDKMLVLTDQYASKLELIAREGRRIYPEIPDDDRPAAGTPHLNFINSLLGREELRAPVRYGVLLSALMDALYESADKKRPVQVKPVPAELAI
jgi:predicted dehydrogenase